MGFVYVLQHGDRDLFKIGKAKDLEQRLRSLRTGNPEELRQVDVIESEHYCQCETFLHHRLSARRVRRGGGDEWFELDPEELEAVLHDARVYVTETLPIEVQAEEYAQAVCEDRVVEPTPEDLDVYRELLTVREQFETLKLEKERLEARLKVRIGLASGMTGVADWKTVTQRRFQADEFANEQPELYAQFLRDCRARRFTLV